MPATYHATVVYFKMPAWWPPDRLSYKCSRDLLSGKGGNYLLCNSAVDRVKRMKHFHSVCQKAGETYVGFALPGPVEILPAQVRACETKLNKALAVYHESRSKQLALPLDLLGIQRRH